MKRKKVSTISLIDPNLSNNQSRIPNQVVVEHDYDINDWYRFIECVRRSLRTFFVEQNFMGKIIDPNDKVMKSKILERIFDPVMRFLTNEAQVYFLNPLVHLIFI